MGDECQKFRWMYEKLFNLEKLGFEVEEEVKKKIEEFNECILSLYYLHKTRRTSRNFYSSW